MGLARAKERLRKTEYNAKKMVKMAKKLYKTKKTKKKAVKEVAKKMAMKDETLQVGGLLHLKGDQIVMKWWTNINKRLAKAKKHPTARNIKMAKLLLDQAAVRVEKEQGVKKVKKNEMRGKVKLHKEKMKKREKSLKRHKLRMIKKAQAKEKRQKASNKAKVANIANQGKERKTKAKQRVKKALERKKKAFRAREKRAKGVRNKEKSKKAKEKAKKAPIEKYKKAKKILRERSGKAVRRKRIATVKARRAAIGVKGKGSKGTALRGRRVWIDLPRKQYLTLCEVKVQSRVGGPNIARGRPTRQISTGWGGSSSRAVDGRTTTNYGRGSCTHTHASRPPWWYVDLGGVKPVAVVTVWNRGDCCGYRLNNFAVRVGNSGSLSGNKMCGRRHSVGQGRALAVSCVSGAKKATVNRKATNELKIKSRSASKQSTVATVVKARQYKKTMELAKKAKIRMSVRRRRINTSSRGTVVSKGYIKARVGHCLHVPNFRSRTKPVMYGCNTANRSQKWDYNSATGLIKSSYGVCLDASQRNRQGGKVRMWGCNARNYNQQWSYNKLTGQIKNKHGICLDASGRTSQNGLVHMWRCNVRNANQQWKIVRL